MSWTDQFLVNGATTAPTTFSPPSVVNPAGYVSSPSAAAGSDLVSQGGTNFAGFWGAILAPLSQGLASRIAGTKNGTGSTVAPQAAQVSAPVHVLGWVIGGAVLLVLTMFVIKKL